MLRHAARRATWILVAALCSVAVYAFFSAPIPPAVSFSLAVLGLLAVCSTVSALLVLAAFGPIAAAVHGLLRTPYDGSRLLEVAVLVVCGGAALRAAIRGSRVSATTFECVALGFAVVAAASCIAQMPIGLLRLGATNISAASELVLRDFFADRSPPLVALWQTAVLVKGVALAVLTARVIRTPELTARLVRMIVAGGAAAAALNVHRLLEVSLRNPPVADGLVHTLKTYRFNTQFGDLNAAGSFFAMVAVLCFSSTVETGVKSWRGRLYAGLLVLFGCALWVSGSRVALIATALCGAAVLVARLRPSFFSGIRWRTASLAGVTLAIVFAAALFFFPAQRHGTFGFSVFTRVELLKAGARMWLDHPFVGVGISQFYGLFPVYASPELLAALLDATGIAIRHENAHNQFLQILAELGILGFAAFAVLLICALWPGRLHENWSRNGPVVALVAFLITCLAGHPLLTPIVTYSFWMVVGLAASGAPLGRAAASRRLRYGVIALGVLLLVTLPVRWQSERRTADLGDVSLGFSPWNRDSAGTRFRWSSQHSTFFVTSRATLLRLPLRSPDSSSRRVEVLLDGRPAAGYIVAPAIWIEANLPLPRSVSTPAFRRIDLNVHVDSGAASVDAHRLLMVGRPVELMRETGH